MYTVLYITHSIELVGVQAVKRTNIKRRAISDTVLLNLEVNQIINIKEVIQFTDVSCSTIYEIMDEFALYYDPTFHKKFKSRKSVLAGLFMKSINALKIGLRVENKLSSVSSSIFLFKINLYDIFWITTDI